MEKRAYEEVTKNPLHTNQCKAGFLGNKKSAIMVGSGLHHR
ncbi:hypothetical protein IGI41_000017 [Enterococcus sp. DIV0876]